MDIKRHKDPTKNLYYLVGALDESAAAPLSRLAPSLTHGTWTLDCGGITAVNSIGILGWISFMKDVRATIVLDCVPLSVLDTAVMIDGFLAKATLRNVECAFICDSCAIEFRQYRPLVRGLLDQPSLCPKCGGEAEPTEEAAEILEDLIP